MTPTNHPIPRTTAVLCGRAHCSSSTFTTESAASLSTLCCKRDAVMSTMSSEHGAGVDASDCCSAVAATNDIDGGVDDPATHDVTHEAAGSTHTTAGRPSEVAVASSVPDAVPQLFLDFLSAHGITHDAFTSNLRCALPRYIRLNPFPVEGPPIAPDVTTVVDALGSAVQVTAVPWLPPQYMVFELTDDFDLAACAAYQRGAVYARRRSTFARPRTSGRQTH